MAFEIKLFHQKIGIMWIKINFECGIGISFIIFKVGGTQALKYNNLSMDLKYNNPSMDFKYWYFSIFLQCCQPWYLVFVSAVFSMCTHRIGS